MEATSLFAFVSAPAASNEKMVTSDSFLSRDYQHPLIFSKPPPEPPLNFGVTAIS